MKIENLKYYRKKANLTQKQLAEKCGLAPGTIQQYELGKREPKYETLLVIANALDTSIGSLLNLEIDNIDEGSINIQSYGHMKNYFHMFYKKELSHVLNNFQSKLLSLANAADSKNLYDTLFGDACFEILPEYITSTLSIAIERCNIVIDEIDLYRDEDGVIDGSKIMDYLYSGKKPIINLDKD